VKSIPTVYRDVEYRSRLEAKWAAFFDQLGWQHTYEPFDGDGYIPDFLVHDGHYASPLLIEVKPAVTEDDYLSAVPKVREGLRHHWDHAVFIAGVHPMRGHQRSAGLIAYRLAKRDGELVKGGWDFTPRVWWHTDDQRVWLSPPVKTTTPASTALISAHWASATNCVKWRSE